MFLDSVWSFVTYEGQTSKNVHDVLKVCLRKWLCTLLCFTEFYVFFLIKIKVGCS